MWLSVGFKGSHVNLVAMEEDLVPVRTSPPGSIYVVV